MNRRELLKGMVGMAAAAVLPVPLEAPVVQAAPAACTVAAAGQVDVATLLEHGIRKAFLADYSLGGHRA